MSDTPIELSTKIVYIYALIDPTTDTVRYVGQTIKPKERFYQHTHSQDIKPWISVLMATGVMPLIKILEVAPHLRNLEREGYWIDFYRSEGHLVNRLPATLPDVLDIPAPVSKEMTESEFNSYFVDVMHAYGSLKVASEAFGFSAQYLGDIMNRGKSISAELAKRMGYRRVVRFEEIQDNAE